MTEEVRIEKLVHGGQGIGVLPDGRKVFVWNVLPDELVAVRLIKSKRDYAEGIAEEILESSQSRIAPRDEAYLSTSPWQIMTFETENILKAEILKETLLREKVNYDGDIGMVTDGHEWNYRNKMEYSFWGDETGLHLALFHRGSHGKRIVEGSSIARPEIDVVARKVLVVLQKANLRAGQMKTMVLRCNQGGQVTVALFVKDEDFPVLDGLQNLTEGVVVYYSNPKSPASIATRELYRFGDVGLADSILGKIIHYDVNSFFQVNVPVFERALLQIKDATKDKRPLVDFYSGVGTIGIPLGADLLVENDKTNIEAARKNIGLHSIRIVTASAENALECIPKQGSIVVDPPRAGLHKSVTTRLVASGPNVIAYLSCNPITLARDLAALQNQYDIETVMGYNFFPRTPHIECLAILTKS